MDETVNHHSQQTDTRTENQTPRVLTHRQVLNNENTWTQGGEHHTLRSVEGGLWEGQSGVGSWAETMVGTVRGRELSGITWGEMPDIGDAEGGSKPHCHVRTYATILHALYMYPRT